MQAIFLYIVVLFWVVGCLAIGAIAFAKLTQIHHAKGRRMVRPEAWAKPALAAVLLATFVLAIGGATHLLQNPPGKMFR